MAKNQSTSPAVSHSLPTERAALVEILTGLPEASPLLTLLQPEDFFDKQLRRVFSVAKELSEKQIPVDVLSVLDSLQDESFRPILAGLLEEGVLPVSSESMFRILRRHRAARESVAIYRQASGKPIEEVPALLSEQSKVIADLLPQPPGLSLQQMTQALAGDDDRVPTGVSFLDALYGGGVAREALHIFAGRPGTGKSSILTQICSNLIRRGVSFHLVSLEMSWKEVMTRILCHYHGLTAKEVRASASELLAPLQDATFHIQTGSGTLLGVQAALLASEADVLLVDHLGLITDSEAGSKVNEVSNVTRMLKLLAMDSQKPVIAACQMSRAIEQDKGNREPRLSDLRDSGSVEQDADNVTFLWDPFSKDDAARAAAALEGSGPDQDEKEIRLFLRKQRNGPLGQTTLRFLMPMFTMREAEAVTLPRVKAPAPRPAEMPF